MTRDIGRRRFLIRSVQGAAVAAGAGATKVLAAEEKQFRQLPDKSGRAASEPVSVQRCTNYDPQKLRQRVDKMLDQIGGIGDLVGGKKVTIKLNLVGNQSDFAGLPAYRTYQVHPSLVATVCAALHDAGAKRIVLVESLFQRTALADALTSAGWDLNKIKSAGGQKVDFMDTRNRGEYDSYATLKVPWGGWLYPSFDVNRAYEETDVMVSLAKLKDHSAAGVTLGTKNLFGMPPNSLYGDDAPSEDATRSRIHILHFGRNSTPSGVADHLDPNLPNDHRYRVPRVTADLLGARPVALTIIDGIDSVRGGEGPWIGGVEPIKPDLLLAGRNAVCTDAVATAAMGYDPQSAHFQGPFQGQNHLKLLRHVGVGEIDPARIDVRGLTLKEAVCPFAKEG